MAKSKLDQQGWDVLIDAYEQWDTSDPNSGGINELVAAHGVSKQALYYQLQRRGIQLKGDKSRQNKAGALTKQSSEAFDAILDMLIESRMQNARLEALLDAAGIGH